MAEVADEAGLAKGSVYLYFPSKEELLLDPVEAPYIWKLRRVLHSLESGPAIELLIDRLRKTKSNREFLAAISKVKGGNGD